MKKVKKILLGAVKLFSQPELRPIEVKVGRAALAAVLAYIGYKTGSAVGI